MTDKAATFAARQLAREYGFRSWRALARDLELIQRRFYRRRIAREAEIPRNRQSRLLRDLAEGDPISEKLPLLLLAELAARGYQSGDSTPEALRHAAKGAHRWLRRQPSREPDAASNYALHALVMLFDEHACDESGRRTRATSSENSPAVRFVRDVWRDVTGDEAPGAAWLRQRVGALIREIHEAEQPDRLKKRVRRGKPSGATVSRHPKPYISIFDQWRLTPHATNAAHVDVPPAPTGNMQEDFRCDDETNQADPPS